MKNLWTVLPPLLSDNFGFIELVKGSDGCGIIDDSGDYRLGGSHGDGHGSGHAGGRDGREGRHHGDGFHRDGKMRGGKGGKGAARVMVSGADAQDVTVGTREKLLQAFRDANARYNPNFALFSAGPCGAMIGTDLSEIAESVAKEYGIPAAAVDLTGQKTYDVGISRTTEAMAKLLAEDCDVVPGTVNILGATALDWAAEDVSGVKAWAERQGYQVLAQPGGIVTAQQMKQMGKAQLNLVTTVSGMAAAKYLQNRFGTPYLAAAPFGMAYGNAPQTDAENADVLIIAEQFTANTIRSALESKKMAKGADVATFYQLDKSCARSGDKRIRGEESARELLNSGKYRTVIADPLLRPLLRSDCKWIDLPHKALNTSGEGAAISLLGSNLDNWLERQY